MRNVFIAAALLIAATAQASQTDEATVRQVLEMEGVGQVLPAASTPASAKPALQPMLKPARAEVIAELQRARKAGELRAANEEMGDFALPQNVESPTRLGRWLQRVGSR